MTNKNNQCDAAVNYGSIHQLNKKEDGKERKPIFPVTPIQAVYDARTGASLEAILAQFNAIYVQYQGSPEATRNVIPEVMRRAGLTITYMDMDSKTITERANSAVQKDNDHWGLDVNWSRVDELSLSGDISVSSKGTWIINGKDTGVKALGPKGDTGLTPWLKTIDNKLHFSYDNVTWEPCSENIAAWFRFNATSSDSQAGTIGRIQISRDNKTWTDLSPEFRNYLRIQGYVATTSALPANQVVGTIYGVGPTYAADDTAQTNPIYRLHVWNGSSWVDNGSFTSIAAGVVQETGDSETEVMSQKAVTEKLSELGSEVGGEVDLTKSINGSISSDNTWVEGTHTIINLYPYDKVTIQSSSSIAIYALLKTDSTSVVEYVDGTDRTSMSSNRIVEFIVDEKCCLYIHKVGANGIDYTPLSVNIKNRFERLSDNLKDNIKELNKLQHETVGNIVSPKGSGYISTKVDIGTVVNENVTSNSNFVYYVLNVDATKKLEITGHGGVNGLLWAFVDDNNLLISRSLGGLVLNKEIVDVPENAKKAIINVEVSYDYEIRVLSLYSTRASIATIDNKMNVIDLAFGNINYNKGYITTGDAGATIPSYTSNGQNYWLSSVISVKVGDTFYIEGRGGNNARLWAFIDENDVVLSSSSANYISTGENIIAPINSKFLIVNFGTAYKHELYVSTRFDNKIENLPIENIKGKNVLVFGNSYSYRSTAQGSGNVLNLFKSLNIPVFLCVIGNPGATFESNYTKHINGEVNEYRWEGDINSGVSNKTAEGFTYIDALKYKEWDYIIFHQASKLSGNISSFSPYLQELIDVAKIHCDNENVKFGLMQTWAYADNPSTYPTSNTTEPVFDSQIAMYNAICETYRQALSQFDDISFIVPAGTALQNARNTDLGDSYDDFASSSTDSSHINDYGTLVTSLVYFNKIYGDKNNVSLSKVSNTYSSLLTDDEFEIAKKCAKKAILHPFGVL